MEERFRAFEINRTKRDQEVDRRMERIEALQRHQGENMEKLLGSLLLFIDPIRWLRKNWIAVFLLGGFFTIAGGAGVGSALKLLSQYLG